jgi:predicted nucleic acid-binding protein
MLVSVAVLDACVLYPAPLRDLFMRLATTGLFHARWTIEIHEEWMRSVLATRQDLSWTRLERTRELMDAHVEGCLISGFEPLIPTLSLPDPDDRHVLAAAIHGRCDTIVTFNLKDFPPEVLAPYGVGASHPDDFVMRCLEMNSTLVCQAVQQQYQALRSPPMELDALLDILYELGMISTVGFLRHML